MSVVIGRETGSSLDDPDGEYVGTMGAILRNPRHAEQPAAQSRELCRLVVPKVPVPPGGSRDEKEAWGSWVWFVRKFAAMAGVRKVDRPCRVEATVRIYEGRNRRVAVGYATTRWFWGIDSALTRSIVPADLLMGLEVRFEPIDPATPLEYRPQKEGCEIIIYEA